jgi:hypothetical protein
MLRGCVMVRKFAATFDGQALRPDGPVDLKPNERYVVTVEPADAPPAADDVPDISAQLAALATDMGVTDLAERHREYARGRKFGGKLPE